MAQVVFKYKLCFVEQLTHDRFTCTLPFGATILAVAVQDKQVTLWALVDPGEDIFEVRSFFVAETGKSLPDDVDSACHVGTCIELGGRYVFHVFEIGKEK